MASSGNFCTLNPLDSGATLINGNLTMSHTTSAFRTAFGTLGVSSGKWYFESRQINTTSGNAFPLGVQRISEGLNNKVWTTYVGNSYSTYGYSYSMYSKGSGDTSEKIHNNSFVSMSDITAGVEGDIYQIALDLDNSKIWFGKNNTWHNSGDPGGNSNETYSSVPVGTWCSAISTHLNTNDIFTHNYGQDSTFGGVRTAGGNADGNGFGDFVYAPPTGFLAICTGNLPISADIDPAQTSDDIPQKQFNAITWTGDGTTGRAISGLGFSPDLIWFKDRTQAFSHRIYDTSRGIASNGGKRLFSNNSNAETDQTSGQDISAVGADGFTLGASDANYTNYNTDGNVAWCWRANGGTTSSDDSGDITVTRQTNDAAKFSILTYTGSGTDGQTVAHGLGVEPDFIIATPRNSAGSNRVVWIRGFTLNGSSSEFLKLNTNDAVAQSGQIITVSSSTIGVGGNANLSGKNQLLYAWANVEGMQRFGKYIGNGNEDGPFIYTGFRPRLLVIKGISATNNWMVFDTARETFNPIDKNLHWDTSDAEATEDYRDLDILSNGFKIRSDNGTLNHPSGDEYIFMAWGDVPFKYNNTF